MAEFEPFTLVEQPDSSRLFDSFQDLNSAKSADHDLQYLSILRKAFPEYVVTSTPTGNCNLLAFARAGNSVAELDLDTDSYASWRGWIPSVRAGQRGNLGESIFFAKYRYQWGAEEFILYVVRNVQYVLKEPQPGESPLSHSSTTDALIEAAGTWQTADEEIVWVYDTNMWTRSKALFNQVKKAEWKNVILDEGMKKTLTSVSTKFFDSKDVYEDLGVPWKRGIIFHGPAGNGKTISIKALMHTLLRSDPPVPTLYVKAAPATWAIRNVFTFARRTTPCLLVFEDIDTVVTEATRSYFFNEIDGLENNDGILMVASTNHLDRLDPGITKRPSRFDRKYLFSLPSEHERELYCEFWRGKLQERRKSHVEFPKHLCHDIAVITDEFSFAYLQEAFVAALLAIARDDGETSGAKFWIVIKEQVRILREDMNTQVEATKRSGLHGHCITDLADMSGSADSTIRDEENLHILDSTSRELPNRKYQVINPAAFAWQ